MKKIISPLLFVISAGCVHAQSPAEFDMVSQLKSYKGPAKIAHVKEAGSGGTFYLQSLNGHATDNGIWLPSAIDNAHAWVRDTSKSKATNVQWFGAVGGGIATYKKDSAALADAVDYINAKGGGALYVPATSSFYGYYGLGLPLKINFEVYGDGAKSNIRCINPNWGININYHGTIFFTGTIGPPRRAGMFKPNVKTFYAYDIPRFQKFVKLRNVKDAAYFNKWIGKGFIIGSNAYLKDKEETRPRFSRGEVNSVVNIGHDTLYLKYPASNRYQADTGYVTLKIIDGATSTETWNGYPDFTGQNIKIHDITLSQATKDEITNEPYKWQTQIGNQIAMGEIYEGEIYNTVFDGYGTFGGNMFNQFKFHNNIVNTSRKCLDLGFNTNNFYYYDNVVNLSKTSITTDTSELAAFYLTEGSGSVSIYNNVFNGGTWSGLTFIQIAGAMKYLSMHDNVYNFPEYKENNRNWILINDDKEDSAYVHDLHFYNETYNFGYCKSYIRAVLKGDRPRNRNIVFDNIKFNGSIVQDRYIHPVDLVNCGNIKLNNVSFKEGDTLNFVINDKSAKISNINAPQSYIMLNNRGMVNNLSNLKVRGTLFRQNLKGKLDQ